MADIITYPEDGIQYDAEDASGYLATRLSGVYSAEEDFSVAAQGGLSVQVSAGQAWVRPARFKGRSIIMEQPTTVVLTEADPVRSRIDRIVLRYDAAAKKTRLQVLDGTPDSAAPAAPEISRTELVYDLCLAEIKRPAGSTAVTAADITDTRADETVCGVMRDGVTGIPTAQLQTQVKAMLDSLQAEVDSRSFYTKAEADAEHAKLQEQISKAGGNVGQAIPVWSSTITLGYYANYSYQVPDNVDYVVVSSDCAGIGNSYVILRGATTDTFYGIKFESNGNLHGYNNGGTTKFYVLGYHQVATGDGSLIPQVVGSKKVRTESYTSTTFSVDTSVDYIVATWPVSYDTDSKKYDVKCRELRIRGDESGSSINVNNGGSSNASITSSFLKFSKAGKVSVPNSSGNTEISLTFYHILTSEELSAQTEALAAAQAAQADADEMNVDQAYRLTLLELNVSDTDDTENT